MARVATIVDAMNRIRGPLRWRDQEFQFRCLVSQCEEIMAGRRVQLQLSCFATLVPQPAAGKYDKSTSIHYSSGESIADDHVPLAL